jgi:peptidoglycan/LPS O-acetylase OafA/YrhL
VFFVLSGYLLSRPFVAAFVHDQQRPGLRRYVRNRVLRIVPAYWAALTVIVVLAPTIGIGAGRLARTYLFDADWPNAHPLSLWIGQAWTLDVEMRFYLLLAIVGLALVFAARRLLADWSVGARVALVLLIAAAVLAWSCHVYAQLTFPDVLRFDENVGRFMLGIALAAVEALALARLLRARQAPAPALALGLFAVGVVGLVLASIAQRDAAVPLGAATGVVIAVCAGAVVAGPLLWQWTGRAPWRMLDNRVLRWAGSRSYSIYLVHFAVYYELGRTIGKGGYAQQLLVLALVGFPLSLLVAEILHRTVERPALRRRQA